MVEGGVTVWVRCGPESVCLNSNLDCATYSVSGKFSYLEFLCLQTADNNGFCFYKVVETYD